MKGPCKRNVKNKPGIASRMKRGALALMAIVGTSAAVHARTDLSQDVSDAKVESGEKTVKCCPIVVPRERSCRSPLKPVPTVKKKSWSGSWNYWRKAKAEAKARALAEAKIKAEARAKAEAKLEAEARAKAEAKLEAEARDKAEAKLEAEARARAEAKLEAEAREQPKAKEQARVEEHAKAKVETGAKDGARAKIWADTASRVRRARALAKARARAIAWLWRKQAGK